MRILLKIKYMGSAYCGFQYQKNGNTVQKVLTEAAKEVFGRSCTITGCSRTDAGVHALGFCALAECEGEGMIPVGRVHRAFASHLPEDIAVVAAAEVSDDFHPRYSAVGKEYIYRILDSSVRDPFEVGRSMFLGKRIDDAALENMQRAASGFLGKHDFSSFMATGSKITDAVRTVSEARVYREESGCLVFSVRADGFLYNMVRIMAGTLTEVARGRRSYDDIPKIIEAKDRSRAGITAPPEGLYLREVFYEENICWQSR